VAVKNAAGNGYLRFIAWAMTIQLSTREVVSSLGETFSSNGYGEGGIVICLTSLKGKLDIDVQRREIV